MPPPPTPTHLWLVLRKQVAPSGYCATKDLLKMMGLAPRQE